MLKLLRSIVPSIQANFVLTHVRVEDGKVFAANYGHWAEAPWDLVQGLPRCCIPYKELSNFLSLCEEGEARIEMKDDTSVVIKAGRRRATLPVIPVDDFPALDHAVDGRPVKVAAEDLELALHAVSKNDRVFPALSGVCIRINQIAATDKHRIVRRPAHAPEVDIVLPLEFCQIIVDRSDDINLLVTDSLATYRGEDGMLVTTKLIDGKFPEINRVWPQENPPWRAWPREEFAAALDTVDLTTGSDAVRITIKDGQSRWMARDKIGKEFVYEGPCDGDDIEITFARKYLRDALAARPDDEEVRLGMSGPESPAMFGDDELIMPMRG